MTIACIVEGDGKVRVLPVLLRRLAESRGIFDLRIPTPIRVHRDRFIRREEEFRRKLLLAAAKADGGTVLILLDASAPNWSELNSRSRSRATGAAAHWCGITSSRLPDLAAPAPAWRGGAGGSRNRLRTRVRP